MKRSFLATVIEKLRGRSLATLVSGWQRQSWERQLEKATRDAQRLAEEAKRPRTRPGE